MDFKNCYGKVFKFYGVYDQMFKLNQYVFEAIEDENDGYRSYLESIEHITDENLVFLNKSFADVRVVEDKSGNFEGYVLEDVDTGHVWLRVGTDGTDDYYPYFVFEYKTPGLTAAQKLHRKLRAEMNDQGLYTMELFHKFATAMDNNDLDAAEEILNTMQLAVDNRNEFTTRKL
jgi:hypothetical protein